MIIIIPNPADITIAKTITEKDIQKSGVYYIMTLGKVTIGLTNTYNKIPELQIKLKDYEQNLVKYAYSQWNTIQQQKMLQNQKQR